MSNFVYQSADINGWIKKFDCANPSGMTLSANSTNLRFSTGLYPRYLCTTDTHVYVVGADKKVLAELDKTTMGLTRWMYINNYGMRLQWGGGNDLYIYSYNGNINKFNISGFTEGLNCTAPNNNGGLLYWDGYIYAGSDIASNKIFKIRCSDMVKVAEVEDAGTSVRNIVTDGTYLYSNSAQAGTLSKWDFDLNLIQRESTGQVLSTGAMHYQKGYLYLGNGMTLTKVNAQNLETVASTSWIYNPSEPEYPMIQIRGVWVDGDENVYAAGSVGSDGGIFGPWVNYGYLLHFDSNLNYIEKSATADAFPPIWRGASTYNIAMDFEIVPPEPSAPTGLTATTVGETTIDIEWTCDSPIGDLLVQTWNGSTWNTFATLEITDTSYQLTGLQRGVEYTIRVAVLYDAVYYPSNTIVETTIGYTAPQDLHFVSGTTTLTTVGIEWTNNNPHYVGYNLIQYKDLTYGTNGGNWTDAGTVAASATTYTLTGLIPFAEYEVRVVLVASFNPSNSIFITMPAAPPAFCELENQFTVSGSSCGNADGSIQIVNPDYLLFYNFTLTDVTGGTHIIGTGGTFSNLISNYYFLTATVKTFYQVLYGRDACQFDWLKVEDADNPAYLERVVVTPLQCQPFDVQYGRIYYQMAGLETGSTYSFYAFLSDLSVFTSSTGITNPHDFIIRNSPAQCYYVLIRDEVTGCAVLIDNRCVPSIPIFSLSGIKKLWIAKWSDDLDYNYWSTADDDFFLEFEDVSFFLSTKIKNYDSLSGGTIQWYSLPVAGKVATLGQRLDKVPQGFIFTDTLTFAVSKADAEKWTKMGTIINAENKWVYVLQCGNNFYWTGGYRHGGRIQAYKFNIGTREDDNGYALEISCQSENKLLTNLDDAYVTSNII